MFGFAWAVLGAEDPAPAVATAAPGSPSWLLLIPVFIPVIVGTFKLMAPKVPKGWLPVLSAGIGFALALLDYFTGALGGNPVAVAFLGAAGTGLREIADQMFKGGMAPRIMLLAGALAIAGTGCTTFKVDQTDTSPDERIIQSKIRATAWFSSAQSIANLKAVQTDKSQSFGSTGIGQQGSTNIVEALQALDSILGKIRP